MLYRGIQFSFFFGDQLDPFKQCSHDDANALRFHQTVFVRQAVKSDAKGPAQKLQRILPAGLADGEVGTIVS